MENEMIIRELNCLCRDYDGLNKLIVSTKNRRSALNPDEDPETNPIIKGEVSQKGGQVTKYQGLDNIKDQVSRRIGKLLEYWPVWTDWMSGVPGIGPFIGGNLILFYYYRFVPICPKCGTDLIKKETVDKKTEKKINTFYCPKCKKSAKGDGVLTHRIEERDFRQPSSWWHYLGMHCNGDGNKPKRKKGEQGNWSTKGRTIGYQIGDQFNRQNEDHKYKAFLLRSKEKHNRKNENGKREKPWTKGHIQNAARNEAAKLFLSHFWHVARELAGKTTVSPWIIEHGGHTGIIPPYYYEPVVN